MFADEMFCQPNEPSREKNPRDPVSSRPALTAVFVAWALSLVRLILAFVRAELTVDTVLALVFVCGLPSLGLALWFRERRSRRRAAPRSRGAGRPADVDVCSRRLRLVHTAPERSEGSRRPNPNGTRAA